VRPVGRLGLIAGSSVRASDVPAGDWTVINRHGPEGGYALPHEIDHPATMRYLVELGCDRVLALSSVGGLISELGPGTVLCPDDFIALDAAIPSSLEGPAAHRVPGFDPGWRGEVLRALAEAGIDIVDTGTYWQVKGPRLETPAEVRLISAHAEVVGMTVASECVAAGEAGLRYTALCIVDNLANGVADTELTLLEIERNRDAHRGTVATLLAAILPRLVTPMS
jgi:5'-methylthioadenosine phosphorylase